MSSSGGHPHFTRGLALAGLGSILFHVLFALLLVWRLGVTRAQRAEFSVSPAAISAWAQLFMDSSPEAVAVDLVTEMEFLSEAEVLPEIWRQRPGDEDVSQIETAPRIAEGRDPRRPAPDGGEGAGQAHPEAWRMDRQTLRAHLTDGAREYRPARTRQGQRVSSPQAERREPKVGEGDAPQTGQRALALAQQQPLAGEGDEPFAEHPATALSERKGRAEQSGQGPIDAEAGQRRFDEAVVGPTSDVVNQRSASNERQPGPLDLSAAGAQTGPGASSPHGPAETPGAVADAARGKAASLYGAPTPVARGADVALSAREAQRARYEREIKRRAQSMLKFPRRLALELRQGETIVRFAVNHDGLLQGPVAVTKSAGFREFDEEAVAAVKRAAPFPRMPQMLVVHMRVAFENPVLR